MEIEKFAYDNRIVRNFAYATIFWGLIGMVAGLLAAIQLFYPIFNFGTEYTSFGRVRPLHTNAVIFAFVGNGIFAGVYYSLQRLCKTRMYSDLLSKINFWGWQLIIVAAAITLPLGLTSGKEYAELEWPIDIAITLIWVVFGWNMFATIVKRRERHLYVAIWFYIATFVTVAVLHLVNSFELPYYVQKLFMVCRRAGRAGAMVVWTQCGGFLFNHSVFRPDVLFRTEGGQPPGIFLPLIHYPLLGAHLYLYLGRSAPFTIYRPARLGAIIGRGILGHADRSFLGWYDQRVAYAARRLG
jgi:cbb3-type cytochrome c oxidase subunit I